MAPVPTAERPPKGLDATWLGVWRRALAAMKEQGTWAWELKPLLDEYVYALRAAQATRDGFAWLDALERYAEGADDLPEIAWSVLREIAGSLPTQWDRHTKRAAALADQLALTPRGRKAIGLADNDEEKPADPFDGLDELAPRRQDRSQAA
jgi:hypothetical protein